MSACAGSVHSAVNVYERVVPWPFSDAGCWSTLLSSLPASENLHREQMQQLTCANAPLTNQLSAGEQRRRQLNAEHLHCL
jgi:hypothetical protein